jgi:hypothetical protein
MTAPMIRGCVDYVSSSSQRHYQTRFMYEVDKIKAAGGFDPIIPAPTWRTLLLRWANVAYLSDLGWNVIALAPRR